jgi:hypothetical protein
MAALPSVSLFALWLWLGISPISAQTLLTPNPADMADGRTNLVNPAVVSWQDPLFSLGTRILHLGVVDNSLAFRTSYFSLTAVNRSIGKIDGFGFGLQGQFFNSPSMNRIAVNGLASRKLFDQFSVGASVGILNQSFDRSQFVLDDENDPVLAKDLSKWVLFNLGAGILVTPNRHLALGLSVNQLSRPNIAIGNAEVRLPRLISGGAVVGMSYFRAILGFTAESDDFLPMVIFESFKPELGFLKIGYGSEAATFEGQLHLARGVSLNYRYAYPVTDLRLASSGSHELGLVFNFRKRASLYEPEWLQPEFVRRPVINPATAFVVESVFDTLLIVDKYIKRKVDPNITQKELGDLPEDIFFSADSLEPDLPKIGAGRLLKRFDDSNGTHDALDTPQDSLDILHAMRKNHTANYLNFLRNLATRMRDPVFRARIVIPPDSKRARLLLKYLTLYGPVTDRLEIVIQDSSYLAERGRLGARKIPEHVFYRTLKAASDTFTFFLNLDDLRWGPVEWTFFVENVAGEIILAVSGDRKILSRYVWDWRLQNGQLPPPGTYYYYIRWRSEDHQNYISPKKALTINRIDRHIAIEISRRKDLSPDSGTKATFVLN